MSVEQAQAKLAHAHAVFEVDAAQVREAYQHKQDVARDVACGILLDTDPVIAEADRTFNACRLVAWQSRDAVDAAQQLLAEAQQRAQAGPSPFARALAWGEETQVPEYATYRKYEQMFKGLRAGIDPTYGRYESAVRKARNELLRVHREAQEVAACTGRLSPSGSSGNGR